MYFSSERVDTYSSTILLLNFQNIEILPNCRFRYFPLGNTANNDSDNVDLGCTLKMVMIYNNGKIEIRPNNAAA